MPVYLPELLLQKKVVLRLMERRVFRHKRLKEKKVLSLTPSSHSFEKL